MANSGEVEEEYESQPEKSLLQRRREASDDDDGVEEEESRIVVRLNRSVRRIGYADESDGRDGLPEYYDDDEGSYVDELKMLAEQVEEESQEKVAEQVTETKQRGNQKVNDAGTDAFAVPRIGAFYMHDDRSGGFRCGRRGRRRRKDFWESKDELKWTHDKFEELTLKETHNLELNAFEVSRTYNDYHRGRNKNNNKHGGYEAKESRPNSISSNCGSSSRIVKGRGPVRYKPLSRSGSVKTPIERMQLGRTQRTNPRTDSARIFSADNKQKSLGKPLDTDSQRALSTPFKQSAKCFEMTRDTDSSTIFSTKSEQYSDLGKASYTAASVPFHGFSTGSESLPFDQYLLAPKMSSYQQTFYPASSFHYDNFGALKSMVLPGSRNVVPQCNEFLQGNIALDVAYAKERVSLVAENHFTESPFQYPVPGSTYMASFESRNQRIGSSMSLTPTHQATLVPNQLNRVSSLAQHSIVQQMPVDSTIQHPSQVLTQQFHSCLGSRSQKLFEASSLSFFEHGILESLTGSTQSKVASLGTGSNTMNPPQYPGIQGNQNINATPLTFPVMQIEGTYHGDRLGAPAIDTISTGYTVDSQVHLRNPDLTWLPVLPAVGATYSPACVAPDGNFYGLLTTTSSVDIASYATQTPTPINEEGTPGPSNGSLPPLKTEQGNSEGGTQSSSLQDIQG